MGYVLKNTYIEIRLLGGVYVAFLVQESYTYKLSGFFK